MQAAAGAGRTGGGGDAGTRGSGSSVLQGAEPRPPVLPDAAAATSPGDTSATGRHGAGGRAVGEGQREPRERLAGGGCGGSLPRPPAPRSCVRGAEPTRRARGPAAPAATATAVESCDDQAAARALAAALAQPQPLPCLRSTASSETVTSGGRRSRAWSVPGEEDGGAVSRWLDRC